ncbi:MAG: bifunctional hydroxymethylpyrimidine kinase/phosphomethylpyrimidine kinase [Candidatus Symbiobacter sp.]|nr:bifunctional hydroxymethylpyrimidine kinase/phosphomethylpyrimidine kinase [Candidatus Symbiobacter sp.]
MHINGKILVIAGSDSVGGAGIQADIKTITALGGYAMTAVTAVTVQTTMGVVGGDAGIFPLPTALVAAQIRAVWQDLGVDVVKIGMLGDAAMVNSVMASLVMCDPLAQVPIVLDPVMVAKGGQNLLARAAVDSLRLRALPRSTILTPNLPEAEALTNQKCDSPENCRAAARVLLEMMQAGAISSRAASPLRAVLLKGGHAVTPDGKPSDHIDDLLLFQTSRDTTPQEVIFSAPRIASLHTHGTGCSLASAVATLLAQGFPLADAVAQARDYVRLAIAQAPGFGHGHGPLNHVAGLTRSHEL